jgi:hypothetical protein
MLVSVIEQPEIVYVVVATKEWLARGLNVQLHPWILGIAGIFNLMSFQAMDQTLIIVLII